MRTYIIVSFKIHLDTIPNQYQNLTIDSIFCTVYSQGPLFETVPVPETLLQHDFHLKKVVETYFKIYQLLHIHLRMLFALLMLALGVLLVEQRWLLCRGQFGCHVYHSLRHCSTVHNTHCWHLFLDFLLYKHHLNVL